MRTIKFKLDRKSLETIYFTFNRPMMLYELTVRKTKKIKLREYKFMQQE